MLVRSSSPTLGYTLAQLPDVRLPDWLKDWRLLGGIGAALAIALVFGTKTAKRKRRRKLLAARLKYAEEVARIKRTV